MKPSRSISIFIIDDDPLIFFTLTKIIEKHYDLYVMGGVQNGHDAMLFLQDNQPDVVLLDIEMPHMNGIECLLQIRRRYPEICVVLLTSYMEEHYIIEGLAGGARSYLLKTSTFDGLDRYIRDAFNNTVVIPIPVAAKLASFLQEKKHSGEKSVSTLFFQTYNLSRTEQQIVKLLAKRLSTTEIANQLVLQVGTVKNYLVTIFKKLNVQNRHEAIVLIEMHLI